MSRLGETVLMASLVDPDALATLAREGFRDVLIPTEKLRPIYNRAINYYFESGRVKAPTKAVFEVEFPGVLDDYEIDLDHEPDESIEWAIEDLKSSYVHNEGQTFLKQMARALHDAEVVERVDVLHDGIDALMGIAYKLEDTSIMVDARSGVDERVTAYNERVKHRGQINGMSLGVVEIDRYTNGVQPGELAILAAGPKTGKSWMIAFAALQEHRAGRTVVLYTLENTVEMTLDRLACMLGEVDYRRFQQSNLSQDDFDKVREAAERLKDADTPLWVLQPEPARRSVDLLVRDAQLRGAQSLFIDQLSHVRVNDEDQRRPRWEQVGNMTMRLRTLLGGRDSMPCLLAHQINREGVQAADKLGRLEMHHLAESAIVERTADWVFGLYRKHDQIGAQQMNFQTLASRREVPKTWQLKWMAAEAGLISAEAEISRDGFVVGRT